VTATVQSQELVREDPRYLSPDQLSKLGVERLNRYDVVLRCKVCGETWSPELRRNEKLPPGYTQCPNRCNW
jgi:hypothetical protein